MIKINRSATGGRRREVPALSPAVASRLRRFGPLPFAWTIVSMETLLNIGLDKGTYITLIQRDECPGRVVKPLKSRRQPSMWWYSWPSHWTENISRKRKDMRNLRPLVRGNADMIFSENRNGLRRRTTQPISFDLWINVDSMGRGGDNYSTLPR